MDNETQSLSVHSGQSDYSDAITRGTLLIKEIWIAKSHGHTY